MSIKITPDVVAEHGLSPEEYQRILQLLGREPGIVELGIFSVMWSEHCSYKSSKKYLRGFPTTAPWVIQGPGENAGVIDIGDGDAIAFKMESHNHPSFIEPYQGAATGVGGILRDVFTMGARPIANLDCLRFGETSHPKTAFLVSGVVAGIAGYGNCMGIPTVGGDAVFDACYNGNILVNAMTVGLVKKDAIFLGKAAGVGNSVIYVGSKTGRDGIHGATMASDSFGEGSEENRPTVQVGDPFMEKLLLEACLEAMKSGVIVGIQDMGAAGLTSSSFEMASRAGTGLEMNLDSVPQREDGMSAYEIMLSESQERMLMVVESGKEQVIRDIFKKWDLDAAVIGKVTNTGRMIITHKNQVVVDVEIAPLADAAPVYDRPVSELSYLNSVRELPNLEEPGDYTKFFTELLASPNIASKRWIYEQYDHMVGTSTLQCPGGDAGLVRIRDSKKAVAVSAGCNSRYVYLNPTEGAKIAVAENGRNVVCAGAKPMAITDCLNFGNPQNPEIMMQFKMACEGISAACRELNTPVVSGNVSLYNETDGVSIFPTPMIGMVGLTQNYEHSQNVAFKNSGDVILLLGETFAEFGGSEYLKIRTGSVSGECPKIDLKKEKSLWDLMLKLSESCLLHSAHDLSEGGLAVTLAESALAGGMGVSLNVQTKLRGDEFLFSESQSRILISCSTQNQSQIQKWASDFGVPCFALGTVSDVANFTVSANGKILIQTTLHHLKSVHSSGFENSMFKKVS